MSGGLVNITWWLLAAASVLGAASCFNNKWFLSPVKILKNIFVKLKMGLFGGTYLVLSADKRWAWSEVMTIALLESIID